MVTTARTRTRLHLFAAVIVASAVIGAGYAVLLDVVIRSELTPNSLVRGAMRGTIIGAVMWSFETVLVRLPRYVTL